MKRVLLIFLAVLCGGSVSSAQTASPQADPTPVPATAPASASDASARRSEKSLPVRIKRFETPPSIDGQLTDEAWKEAAVLKNFYQIQPGDNIAPSHETEVRLGYDAHFLYIGIVAFDEPHKVRATVAKRDAISEDDYVRITLDTYNDQRKAYVLEFNPLGVQADAIMTEGAGDDYSVDVVMESKGVVTEQGYTVEVAVPFKSLRYRADADTHWGIHVFRRIKRYNNELDSWMPIARGRAGTLNQQGHLTGFEGISTERTLELIPSLTVAQSGRRVRALPPGASALDPGRFLNPPVRLDPGLTAKLGITPNVTLALALNPDFAQVEADATVVTANQRFPIFFAEKRPFFLEGIDIFQTPIRAVHTRAVIDPDVAVKLTGKSGRNSFGVLVASDNAPGNFSEEERTDPFIRPGIERFVDRNAHIGIVRLKRDLGAESSLGLIATSYDFVDRHNRLAGIDGRFRLGSDKTFAFQLLGTNTRALFYRPDEDREIYRTGNGFGYFWNYEKGGRNWSYQLNGNGRTADYRADLGFTPRVNTNFGNFTLRHVSDPQPKARLVSWEVANFLNTDFDWQGRMQRWFNEVQWQFNLQHEGYVGGGFVGGYERLFEEEFGPRRTALQPGAFAGDDPERSSNRSTVYFFAGATPSKTYSFSTQVVRRGGQFDFDFGAGPRFPRVSPGALLDPNAPLDPGPGSELTVSAAFVYRPVDALRASLDYTKSKLRRYDTGRVSFDQSILSTNVSYQFTRFSFARARVDYDSLESRFLGQFLFGWTPNPGTAFYAGYNDDLNRNFFNPFTGQLEPGFRRSRRTFFVKISYLFRRGF